MITIQPTHSLLLYALSILYHPTLHVSVFLTLPVNLRRPLHPGSECKWSAGHMVIMKRSFACKNFNTNSLGL
jgi:hypothetical protein